VVKAWLQSTFVPSFDRRILSCRDDRDGSIRIWGSSSLTLGGLVFGPVFGFEGTDPDVGTLFGYLRLVSGRPNAPGFECYINPKAAVGWVHSNRPHLMVQAGLADGAEEEDQ
jgi:hypothetical protein